MSTEIKLIYIKGILREIELFSDVGSVIYLLK